MTTLFRGLCLVTALLVAARPTTAPQLHRPPNHSSGASVIQGT
jgi:hypothetical protein